MCQVVFYDRMGSQMQHFAYPMTEEKEFTCAQFNPSGQCLVVGSWNKFRVYTFNPRNGKWEVPHPRPFFCHTPSTTPSLPITLPPAPHPLPPYAITPQDAGPKRIPNLYSVTALGWKADGSRLVVASLCGAVDMYDACIRRCLST